MTRDLSLALWQVRYEQRSFWRNPRAAFFTFAFPLMLLAFIGSFGGDPEQFVPGILSYGIAMATYSNLAISFAVLRDDGIIRRVQGTPLPWWTYVAGRIGSTTINAALMTAIALALAGVAFGLTLPLGSLPGFALTMALAIVAFTALGIGIVRYIPNADSAPAIATFTVLPLSFISGVFAPSDAAPEWLQDVAHVFPLEPLGDGLRSAFATAAPAAGVVGADVLVLAAWCGIGALLCRRFLGSLVERA
jgi:ABC-2 type transport system permease protein